MTYTYDSCVSLTQITPRAYRVDDDNRVVEAIGGPGSDSGFGFGFGFGFAARGGVSSALQSGLKMGQLEHTSHSNGVRDALGVRPHLQIESQSQSQPRFEFEARNKQEKQQQRRSGTLILRIGPIKIPFDPRKEAKQAERGYYITITCILFTIQYRIFVYIYNLYVIYIYIYIYIYIIYIGASRQEQTLRKLALQFKVPTNSIKSVENKNVGQSKLDKVDEDHYNDSDGCVA